MTALSFKSLQSGAKDASLLLSECWYADMQTPELVWIVLTFNTCRHAFSTWHADDTGTLYMFYKLWGFCLGYLNAIKTESTQLKYWAAFVFVFVCKTLEKEWEGIPPPYWVCLVAGLRLRPGDCRAALALVWGRVLVRGWGRLKTGARSRKTCWRRNEIQARNALRESSHGSGETQRQAKTAQYYKCFFKIAQEGSSFTPQIVLTLAYIINSDYISYISY